MTANSNSPSKKTDNSVLPPGEDAANDSSQGESDLLGDDPIWTPEIQLLAEAVRGRYRLGFRGMAVDGQQRCGKTSACEFLVDTLPDTIGYPVATFLWSIPEFATTERDFVQERLRDSGCFATSNRDIAILRGRLYDHIAESAEALGSRRAIVVVDEAQNLTRQQYHYLHHCDNNLQKRKVRPFFVLVGQPELRQMTSSWTKSKGFQVVGRFFAHQHTYRGVALADVPKVVKGFDEPAGDAKETTYAHAIPDAYKAGWRLSAVSEILVETITAVAAKQNINAGVRVPMQSLRAMLFSILFQVIDDRVDPAKLGRKMMLKAVRDSAFPTVMTQYVDANQDVEDDLEAA